MKRSQKKGSPHLSPSMSFSLFRGEEISPRLLPRLYTLGMRRVNKKLVILGDSVGSCMVYFSADTARMYSHKD